MNILHVISSMDPQQGGVCQAVRTSIAGLSELGVSNEVVSLDAPDTLWSKADSFPVHSIGPAQGPWSYSPNLVPWLISNFSRFDALILHGLWLYNGYAIRNALRRFKAQRQIDAKKPFALPKIFVMPHGMLDPYFQQAKGRMLKAWRNWAYWQIIEKSVVNDADGILFTCETERLLARKSFTPYNPKSEIVVGLGIEEPPSYMPAMREAFIAKCPELRNRPYILFISRIHDKKGVDLLIEAYKRIVDNSFALSNNNDKVDIEPVLVIAGPGLESAYGQQILRLSTQLPESTVLFPGMLEGDAKWGAFYNCEAFVLPSHQENFGIAVAEALACSKAVLISDQVNIWREIESEGGGIVQADNLLGTENMLRIWCGLSISDKYSMGEKAFLTYRKYFAIGPSSEKMAMALQ